LIDNLNTLIVNRGRQISDRKYKSAIVFSHAQRNTDKTTFPVWVRAFTRKSALWGLGTPDYRNGGPGNGVPLRSCPF